MARYHRFKPGYVLRRRSGYAVKEFKSLDKARECLRVWWRRYPGSYIQYTRSAVELLCGTKPARKSRRC